MSAKPIILRVSATYGLTVKVGDRVRAGQTVHEAPNEDGRFAAPVSGIVKSIEFDAGPHEFVIVITPTS